MQRHINPYVEHLVSLGVPKRTAYRRAKKYGLNVPQMNPIVTKLIEEGMNRRTAYRHAAKNHPTQQFNSSAYSYSTGEFV